MTPCPQCLRLPLLHQQSCCWRPDRFHPIRSPSTCSSFPPPPCPTIVPSKPPHPSSFASWFVSTMNVRSTSSEPGSGSGTSSPRRRGYRDPSLAVPTVLAGLGHLMEPGWNASSCPRPMRPTGRPRCSIRRPIGMARLGLELYRLNFRDVGGRGRHPGRHEIHPQGLLVRWHSDHLVRKVLRRGSRGLRSFIRTSCGDPQAQEQGVPQRQGPAPTCDPGWQPLESPSVTPVKLHISLPDGMFFGGTIFCTFVAKFVFQQLPQQPC